MSYLLVQWGNNGNDVRVILEHVGDGLDDCIGTLNVGLVGLPLPIYRE